MLRVAICDDEEAEVRKIEGFVRSINDFDISIYTSSGELAQDIEDGAAFDIYLLDVIMPSPDGIELARFIREKDRAAAIIYLTSHDGRSLDAFRVRASQYLIKPVSLDTLRTELDLALTGLKARNGKTFIMKTRDGAFAIPFHNIVNCELVDRSLCCLTADGEKHVSVTLRGPFAEAVAQLLADRRFLGPHTSFLVNMEYVRGIQADMLLMRIGPDIPIAHRLISKIKEKYLQYFFKGEHE